MSWTTGREFVVEPVYSGSAQEDPPGPHSVWRPRARGVRAPAPAGAAGRSLPREGPRLPQ